MHFDRLRQSALARPAAFLALCVLAPLAIYAGFNAWLALDRRQAGLTEQSVAGVQALVENIDRQIATGLEDAETLAEAPALDPVNGQPANLKVFEEVARRTAQRHPEWLTVTLLGPDGRWIFTTLPTLDSANRRAEDLPSFDQAIRTGRPVVGDIVKGRGGRWGVALRAPVVRGGKVAYVVSVVMKPEALRQTLSSLRLKGPWITFVVNARGRVVARLPVDERVIGAQVSAQTAAARARGGGGGYTGRGLSGIDNQTFYWTSPQSGWSAHAAIPRAVWEAPLRQMLVVMLSGFLLCLAVAGVLGVLWLRDYERGRRQGAAVELATRIDALGRLTGGVAHDFNNLLTVIQGNTDILARRVKGQGSVDRPIAAIRAATERAAKLTRQLLVFARGGPSESVPVDLTRTVLDLLGSLSQLVGSGVVIETDCEPGLPPVSVDPLQLEAALLNLAANARDAMGGSGMLHLRLRREGDWIALQVRDEGTGFDPSILTRVFDPFFTTKPMGEGTGLGLSQVYGLVKGAGGRVEAANAPGGGALVTLRFPPAGAAAPTVEADAPAMAQAAGAGEATILLVDDNEAVRATTATYLRDGGMAVLEAADAAGALRLLEVSAVEAVVSDIAMPGELDGMALADAIRSARPGLPVLLVSGFSERVAEAHARGFPVINKPYGLPELERRLRLLVEPQAVARA